MLPGTTNHADCLLNCSLMMIRMDCIIVPKYRFLICDMFRIPPMIVKPAPEFLEAKEDWAGTCCVEAF